MPPPAGMLHSMADEWHVDAEDVRALIDEIDVDAVDSGEWNARIWIPEYAEPVLGGELFESLEARLAAIPAIERLVWEDREVFLARTTPGADLEDLKQRVLDVMRGAVNDAGHAVP
jgi:hypothetical protein